MSQQQTPSPARTLALRYAAQEHKTFINDEWVAVRTASAIPIINPASGEQIGTLPAAGAAEVDMAVDAAQQALSSAERTGAWKPAERSRLLWALADAIEANAAELAELESLDVGKPIANARMVDVPGAAAALRYFAGWAGKIGGETTELSVPGRWHAYTRREPVGVVGQIVPWNYPLMGAACKIAPAIAAGCAVVLKPAEQTSLSTLRLAELIHEVGLPPGMANIVPGLGPEAGAALVRHPGVAKISFTGSTATGRTILVEAAATMKRVTLELGGKSPVIVFPDADLDAAARAIAMSIFFNSGQTCSAASRLLVHNAVAQPLLERLQSIADGMQMGDPADASTQLGPLVSAEHHARVTAFVEAARQENGRIIGGGDKGFERGYYMAPTIIDEIALDSSAMQQEIFGPVLCVTRFDTADLQAIAALANDTRYGLAAYIWTRDLGTAHGLIPLLKAGTVRVNALGGNDFGMPSGGFKQSGFGRENGRAGVEAYTELKSVTLGY